MTSDEFPKKLVVARASMRKEAELCYSPGLLRKEPLRCSVLFAALENGPVFMGKGLSEIKSWILQISCC